MLKIAVWGVGEHAIRNAIPALKKASGIELYGLYSRDEEKTKEIATKLNILCWNSIDEMLNDSLLDVVYISTPVGLHYEYVARALSANKHVFCEKSLTTTGRETKYLYELAEGKGLRIFECYMYLFHEQFRVLERLISDGEIGNINSISTYFGYPHLDKNNIRYDNHLGGGSLYDAGVYTISSLIALLGYGYNKYLSYQQFDDAYSVDVGGGLTVVYPNGLTGIANWGMGREYRNEIDIWGSKGIINVSRAFSKPDSHNACINIIKSGTKEVIRVGKCNHFVEMFESFSKNISDEIIEPRIVKLSLETAKLIDLIKK